MGGKRRNELRRQVGLGEEEGRGGWVYHQMKLGREEATRRVRGDSLNGQPQAHSVVYTVDPGSLLLPDPPTSNNLH